jgi:DNA repair protein RecN (Recombination protein N)
MLTTLRIADFAILESAELHFGSGLTAITGETGAGKSILIDALSVVLGGRGSERAIRHGRDAAEIEAQFDGIVDPFVLAQLEELGIDASDGTLVLRRVLARTGKSEGQNPDGSVRSVEKAGRSRCHVNGRLVTAQQLRAIAAPLCDLSSQHAQHRLLDRTTHLEVLDRFAGHLGLRQRHLAQHAAWRDARAQLVALTKRQADQSERLDYLRFVHEELRQMDVKPGEMEAVQVKVQRIQAGEKLAKAVAEASAIVGEDGGIRDLAARAARSLQRMAAVDPALRVFAERVGELQVLADELAHDLDQHGRHLDRDDRELGRLAERLDALHRAFRKHGGSEVALLARQLAVATELDTAAADLRLHELGRDVERTGAELRAIAAELSERRTLAAVPLGERVAAVVQQLGMPAAEFRVALRTVTGDPGPTGVDEAEFQLRANRGESEGPLSVVASGGELSRVLLAVQRAISDAAHEHGTLERSAEPPALTCIYDEADAGLSGSTGLVLGRFLAEVAVRQQVVCISHLPQVAAAADVHVRVSKHEVDGRTRSQLEALDQPGRVAELARMLGTVEGEGDTALAHARRLLEGFARQKV